MKSLTNAEEQVMQILWGIKKGFVKDILELFPEPKPAYNTVSTIVRILEKKGFVSYTAFGKTHEYYPLISKDDYKRKYLQQFVKNYFGNSLQELVSFFSQDESISAEELEEITKIINQQIKEQKKK